MDIASRTLSTDIATYLERYQKVTVADIKRVAKKYLQPDTMVVLVTGYIDECKAGADKSQAAPEGEGSNEAAAPAAPQPASDQPA